MTDKPDKLQPDEDKPDIDTEMLWTEVDDRNLKAGLEAGCSIAQIARALSRSTDEVEQRMRDMGLSVAT